MNSSRLQSLASRNRAGLFLGSAAVLGALALLNRALARRAERRHPPSGRFIEVDGVRLHYLDRGTGSAVVLLHGNAVSADDFVTSSLLERIAREHRVIAFDRPGFGYSERPRGRVWTASAQAELIHKALTQLGVHRAVVVGHSWGALVALCLAVQHPENTTGLAVLAGYYFPTLRVDALPVSIGALPVLGDVLRYTVSPLLGRLLMPLFKRHVFAPGEPTARFKAEFSPEMTVRPWQIRAMSLDGAAMVPCAMALRRHYGDIAVPTVILAGSGDKMVGRRQARRLQAAIPGSSLRLLDGVGHMLHHIAPLPVIEAIRALAGPDLEMPLAAD